MLLKKTAPMIGAVEETMLSAKSYMEFQTLQAYAAFDSNETSVYIRILF